MTPATITIFMYMMRKPHMKLRTYLTSMSNIKKPKTEIKMMREKEEKIKKLENV